MSVFVSRELKVPLVGKLLSDFAVGDIVKLNENGSPVEYIVVNQGIPSNSSLYDSSCNGTWLLRKDIIKGMEWGSSGKNAYANSSAHTYLNGDFISLFDIDTNNAIKQVKIPYCRGNGTTTVYSGSNGLSTKAFLLSTYEVGYNNSYSYILKDGGKLSYFLSGEGASANLLRDISASNQLDQWWLRSVPSSNSTTACEINFDGSLNYGAGITVAHGIRPALVLLPTALFDSKTLLFKEVK